MDKKEALLKFLNEEQGNDYDLDDLEQCSYDENSFDVNPHTVRYGTSPVELIENAQRVRAALEILFPTVAQEKWHSSRVNKRVYRLLDRRLKALMFPKEGQEDKLYPILYRNLTGQEQPPKVPKGKHDNPRAKTYQDIVNFFFHLFDTPRYSKDSERLEQVRNAFDVGKAEEYRELSHTNDSTWLVLTDEEADQKAADYIKDSLWAFNPDFLEGFAPEGVTAQVFENLQPQCESANAAILSMIGDNLEDLISEAISSDGRGHFMNSYDGEEHEIGEFFLYRTN